MLFRLKKTLPQLLWHQFIEFWPYYLGALFSLFMTHWIQSHLPFLAKELAESTSESLKNFPSWKFFLFAIGIIVFRTGSRLLFFYPARILEKLLRIELLSSLENTSPARYRSYSDGQVYQVMSMDMEQMRALIGFALLQIGNIGIALMVLVPKIVSFNANLVTALIPLLISFSLFTYIVGRNRKFFRLGQDYQGDVQNFIIESYAGKKTIKNYHAEKEFVSLFNSHSLKELMSFYTANKAIGIAIPLIPLGVGLSLVWGGHIVYSLDLGAPTLVLFSGFIFLFLEPLMFLSWIGVVFARSMGSWKRICELVDLISTKSSIENFHEENQANEDVKLTLWDNSYSFSFENNSWTVFVGKTGHGKTYLLTQLCDYYRMKDLVLSFVAQDPYLYNDTIEKNIFLGKEPNQEELNKAWDLLVLFGLDVINSDRSHLFNLEVGENGKRLSGGQAKRLALVRSLMSEANVLIWDDPFSSVDLIQEKQIILFLKEKKYLHGKKIILSSHRLSTVRLSDFVYLIDKEKGVMEEGNVNKLLTKGSETYEYFKTQMV